MNKKHHSFGFAAFVVGSVVLMVNVVCLAVGFMLGLKMGKNAAGEPQADVLGQTTGLAKSDELEDAEEAWDRDSGAV